LANILDTQKKPRIITGAQQDSINDPRTRLSCLIAAQGALHAFAVHAQNYFISRPLKKVVYLAFVKKRGLSRCYFKPAAESCT
jgi:hypothetical protein